MSRLDFHLVASRRCKWTLMSGVGKSAITIRFVTSQFYDRYVLVIQYSPALTNDYQGV